LLVSDGMALALSYLDSFRERAQNVGFHPGAFGAKAKHVSVSQERKT
jgi:hypothetical protein